MKVSKFKVIRFYGFIYLSNPKTNTERARNAAWGVVLASLRNQRVLGVSAPVPAVAQ